MSDNGATASTLTNLAKRLRQLPELFEWAAELCGERGKELIAQTFDTGVDPYGEKWRSLKDGRSTRLTRTGTLRRGWRVVGHNRGAVVFRNRVPYARYYQYAWTKERQMVPHSSLMSGHYGERSALWDREIGELLAKRVEGRLREMIDGR